MNVGFYNYLCDIIGSADVVKARRNMFTVYDVFQTIPSGTFISSGSKAEGLYLKGSDYDLMTVFNLFRVYEGFNDFKSDSKAIELYIENNDTKSGFTKLKLVNKAFRDTDIIQDYCETVGGETYISSKRFLDNYLKDGMIIHGPCLSSQDGEYDHAMCLRCKEWITPAQPWIHRSRTEWPHDTLVTSAVQYGVLFVPIGCKESRNENLQWRISFSMTEKLLIHSFTHTQLLCYALMKIILKDLIKPRHGDLLCSYFIKTIMFWLGEEVSPSEWKPENMISCIFNCIRRLIYCVEYKICLHYFIPENNLFEDRFTDKQHKTLLASLKFIYESPWSSLFDTSTFHNHRLELVNSSQVTLSVSELSCLFFFNGLFRKSSIGLFKHRVNLHIFGLNRELGTYMLSAYSREFIPSSALCNLSSKNKLFYRQYQKSLCYFKISLHSYSISSWLLLASLFYKSKQFQECLVIINYSLSGCTPDKIYLHQTNSLAEQTKFKETRQRLGLLIAFKYSIIENVRFRRPFCLLPDELIPAITGKSLIFPPVVYSYLLQFLCYYHLEDYRGKQNALHDLELTIREQYFLLANAQTLRTVNAIVDIVNAL